MASNRSEWVTYNNVKTMYDLVYDQMVEAKIAEALPEEEWFWVDMAGNKYSESDKRCGLQVKIRLTHPEWLLFGDEVGTELNQKDDGNVGGQKYLSLKNTRAKVKSSNTDGRFTVIGLTAASGDVVNCVIIFAAE